MTSKQIISSNCPPGDPAVPRVRRSRIANLALSAWQMAARRFAADISSPLNERPRLWFPIRAAKIAQLAVARSRVEHPLTGVAKPRAQPPVAIPHAGIAVEHQRPPAEQCGPSLSAPDRL